MADAIAVATTSAAIHSQGDATKRLTVHSATPSSAPLAWTTASSSAGIREWMRIWQPSSAKAAITPNVAASTAARWRPIALSHEVANTPPIRTG